MSRLVRFLAALSFAVSLPAHALQEFDACVVGPGSAGTVESVRLVPVQRDLHAFDPEVLEHKVQPEETQELIVRLDTGPVVVFSQTHVQRLAAGERVLLYLDGSTARVERDPADCASSST